MIFKLLTFLIIIFIIYLTFFRKTRVKNKEDIDTMYECSKCKTYITKDEAILSNGKYYCSKECLK
jgi:uncharacterized protein